MDPQQLEFLRSQDWEDLAAKVLVSALFWARKYGWKPGETMAEGATPETITWDVISDFWTEKRVYNPKWTLVTQLRNAARSKISTLCKSKEAETTERLGDDEPEAKLRKSVDDGRRETERLIEIRDLFKEVIGRLFQHPKVQRGEDLQLLVRALAKGLWETAEISKETGLETKRIHQLKRDLRDIYPWVAEKITKDGESIYE
jgi:hypothetical protein